MNYDKYIPACAQTNHGVPYLTGYPGIGKTAYCRGLAKKNNWHFIHLNLATLDEAEVVGLLKEENFQGIRTAGYIKPKWAVEANETAKHEKAVLVMLDEYNRAPLAVRNALLGVMNERVISHDFRFADNVHFIASGNLGEEDGTEVDDLDAAHRGRLVKFSFHPDLTQWVTGFGKEHVVAEIIDFLYMNPQYYIHKLKNGDWLSPRRWTQFSDLLKTLECKTQVDFIKAISEVGELYLDTEITFKFKMYLEQKIVIGLERLIKSPELLDKVVFSNHASLSYEMSKYLTEAFSTKTNISDETVELLRGLIDKFDEELTMNIVSSTNLGNLNTRDVMSRILINKKAILLDFIDSTIETITVISTAQTKELKKD